MKLLLSPNLKEITGKNKTLIYDSKTGANSIIEDGAITILNLIKSDWDLEKIKSEYTADNMDDFIDHLINRKLVFKDKIHIGEYKPAINDSCAKKGCYIKNLRLNVTEECNLDCSYCYERVSNVWDKRRRMSWKTAKKSIDEFLNLQKEMHSKNASIRFFGGEPLINWDIISKSLEYIRKIKPADLEINYDINTNGTLLTDTIAKTLSEHNVTIAVSIDGTKECHDRNRKNIDGKGSFQVINENLKYLVINKCRFYFLSVCTDETLPHLKSFMDYLSERQKELNSYLPIGLSFMQWTNTEETQTLTNDERVNLLIEGLKYAKKIGVGAAGGMSHFVYNKLIHNMTGSYCAATGSEFSINPNGDIFPCSGVDIKLGNINDFKKAFASNEYINLTHRRLGNIEQCENCEIEAFCAGGCVAESKTSSGQYFGKTKNCEITKLTFQALVKYNLLN